MSKLKDYQYKKPTARKPHSDHRGFVCELRNKLCDGHVVILDCKRAELEGDSIVANYKEEGGRYEVFCSAHSTNIYCATMGSARDCIRDATYFCDECRALAGEA